MKNNIQTFVYVRDGFKWMVARSKKKHKYKPSNHIVDNKKKPCFSRAVFNKKGF